MRINIEGMLGKPVISALLYLLLSTLFIAGQSEKKKT